VNRELALAAAASALGLLPLALAGGGSSAPAGAAPARVVSLSPSITEMVHALGALDRVVGVSSWVSWPPEARSIRRVGGYLDVDLEVLVGTRPDLVLVQGVHSRVSEQARELGIEVVRVEMDTVAQIVRAAREIGSALGAAGAGEHLARRIESELEDVRSRSRAARPVRTFLQIGHAAAPGTGPFLTSGGRTFLSEILEAAGGSNVFAELPRAYAEVSAEAIVSRAPELVMVSLPGRELSRSDEEAIRGFWRGLLGGARAGRGPDVRLLTLDCAQVPGPRVGELAREMERLVSAARAWLDGSAP